MNEDKLIIKKITKEICNRYHVKDMSKGEQLLYDALNDGDIQDKIYDKVYKLITQRK